MKKLFTLILSAAVALTALAGCDAEKINESSESSGGPVTLRVVSEFATDAEHGGSISSFAYAALTNIIAEYKLSHSDVNIELTMLPLEDTEREIVLQKMRTEIMAGKGPDIFLLPTGLVANNFPGQEDFHPLDPLFLDVHQAMENRLFADLSEYYDSDEALKTEELKPDIMDAGVYDDCRYVLPIGWNMPVIAVDNKRAEELGIDKSVFSKGIADIYNATIEAGDTYSIYDVDQPPQSIICTFPNLFDYENDSVLWTEEDIMEYYDIFHTVLEKRPDYPPNPTTSEELSIYVGHGFDYFLYGKNAFALTDLAYAADALGIAKYEEKDVSVLPLHASDGSTVAEITYFGAVGAGCQHKKEAYEFLRTFLTPEVQFQQTLSTGATHLWSDDCAWPVRVTGSVNSKYRVAAERPFETPEGQPEPDIPKRDTVALRQVELSDSDLPLLQEPIDHVRFSTPLTYEFYQTVHFIGFLSDLTPENAPEKAAELIASAKYHIAES